MLETGGLRRRLFEWAYSACEPFAEKARKDRTMGEWLTFGLAYLLVFRALRNYVGLRRARW